jgi:type VI secretion system protein ImpJ
MSWHSKLVWAEGLFLRQHHLQQYDRYVEHLLETRVRSVTPYPWGFAELEINRDLIQQSKFGLRRAAGVFQDGTPFDLPDVSPEPQPIDIPEGAERKYIWLTMPVATANMQEVDMPGSANGSRYTRALEKVRDTTTNMQIDEEIEIAHPRAELTISEQPKPGYHNLRIARILEVKEKTIVFDETICPPLLTSNAHGVARGWLDRVIGWVETRLEALARYAADPSSGGGLQALDYYMLQMLNREVNVLKHYRATRYLHPERLYIELIRLAGELSTFSNTRIAPEFPAYDHDNLHEVMEPVLTVIQRLLSLDIGRAIRLDLTEVRANAFLANVNDRNLFRNARFVIEVSANMPLQQIQLKFPELCKVAPNNRMREVVQTNLPGLTVVHMPTPPRQIRTIIDHVYFQLDKNSPLWPEFSVASGIALHFAGNWPGLQLDLWAIVDDQR